jgi:hypothetical protein
MKPAEPDTVLTTMHIVKDETETSVFTNDQQLYKIATHLTWCSPDEWKKFFPILGGMHTLMSFVGSIGTLMANTGLEQVLKSAFGGVEKILQGKNFPQNTRALCICAEEVLRPVLKEGSVSSFREMIQHLDLIAKKSRTARLWLDAFIWPVFLIMRFIRASREAD